ncbi:hypothetical protein CL622_07630 [archaeon]|nr:hypothetical protein [archaeon]|tara:strand:- start:2941 stop:3438 length:498 start_codon:yes stop_codon:yes gene_type:complete
MSELSMFEAILIWDKVMSYKDRRDLVKNNWSIASTFRDHPDSVEAIVETPAEQMSDIDMEKLHKALILSERTMYLKKQLAKIDKKAEKQWNKLRKMYNKNDETWVRDLDIMPKHWAIAVQNCDYDQLSFTIKHLLRASYDNNTNRFAGQHMLYGPKLKTMSEIEV